MAGYQVLNMANSTDFDGALHHHLAGAGAWEVSLHPV